MTHDPRHDPLTYGQKWIDLHTLAASIESRADVPHIAKAILVIISSIKCSKCQRHATKYLEGNDITQCYDQQDSDGRWIGLFDYLYRFHNVVNLRLQKPHMDYKTAHEMYYDNKSTCDDVCGI